MEKKVILTPEEEACLPKQPPKWRDWLILAISVAIYMLFTQISLPGLDANGVKALGYTIVIILLLLFEVFPMAVIAILGVVLEEDFLVDIALVYALLSFLSVVILAKLVIDRRNRQLEREKREKGVHLNDECD